MASEQAWVALPRLGELRNARYWSQYELAQRSGVARNTINRLEMGAKAQRRTIRKLAAALGVAPAALLGPVGEEAPARGAVGA